MKETQTRAGSKPLLLIIAALLLLVLIGIGVLVWRMWGQASETENGTVGEQRTLTVDANVVLDDPQTLQDMVDEMIEKAAEGNMALEMKMEATSSDGWNFNCFIANSVSNSYDMYVVLYLDETEEEIYRSGLIPIGARIERFLTTTQIPVGTHEGTLVYCQVEEDGSFHAQVNVGLNLIVSEPSE